MLRTYPHMVAQVCGHTASAVLVMNEGGTELLLCDER